MRKNNRCGKCSTSVLLHRPKVAITPNGSVTSGRSSFQEACSTDILMTCVTLRFGPAALFCPVNLDMANSLSDLSRARALLTL
jgi:hypothetical protein